MKNKPTLEKALAERLIDIDFCRVTDVPPEHWHEFIYDGWILLVYKNHPMVPKGMAAVGLFHPEQGKPK